jgi:hypothetical protein
MIRGGWLQREMLLAMDDDRKDCWVDPTDVVAAAS